METRSPARDYALAVGATLVVAGIVGFFYSAGFGSGDGIDRETALGAFDVNGWHNVLHIASGVVGLLVAGSYTSSRGYAFGLGAIYLLLALFGFAAGDGGEIAGLLAVSTGDNVLHLLIGFAGLATGFATPAHQAPSTAAPA